MERKNILREIDEKLGKELDKQFPKGDKARKKALILFGIAQNELNKLEKKRNYWEEKYKKGQEAIDKRFLGDKR